MSTNILFLDVDGVLNTPDDWIAARHMPDGVNDPDSTAILNRTRVALLKWFVETCGDVKIVLSSTWKLLPDGMDRLCNLMEAHGWENNHEHFIGCTPTDKENMNRNEEILMWLHENRSKCKQYVILDDMHPSNFHGKNAERHVYTEHGLVHNHVEEMIKLLNKEI